jgi:hypothetical protein
MYDLIDWNIILNTKRTENFFKCCEGYILNNRRSPTGDELQSFDVFGKHLTTSDIFQNYDKKDACDKRIQNVDNSSYDHLGQMR